MRRDAHALVEVQAMCVGAIGPQSRIEVELVAVEPPGLFDHPVHQLARKTVLSVVVSRADVIAVQGMAPREVIQDAKAGHSRRVEIFLDEETDYSVALGSHDLVDVVGERDLWSYVRPELDHGLVGEMGRWGLDLLDHPPICDMLFEGLMNPGWLIRWPSSLRQIAVSITRPRWSSDTPERSRSRSGVSCSEKRHVRRPPSAVSRMRLHAVQKAWLTDEMKPTPPGAPSANLKRVAGPGRGSATGTSGKRSSICSWMRKLGTTCSLVQMPSPSRGMNSMNRTSYPSSRARRAKSTTSSSLWPFITTMFNLIGHRPASRAAWIPSIVRLN